VDTAFLLVKAMQLVEQGRNSLDFIDDDPVAASPRRRVTSRSRADGSRLRARNRDESSRSIVKARGNAPASQVDLPVPRGPRRRNLLVGAVMR
jgi:hypothetical protein